MISKYAEPAAGSMCVAASSACGHTPSTASPVLDWWCTYYLAFDVILLAGILIHGLNGLRVALTGFDVGVRAHKALFGVSILVAAVALVAAALKIFGG